MTDEPRCRKCRFFDGTETSSGQCRRYPPDFGLSDWHHAILAWLFKIYWKDDPEVCSEDIHEITSKYTEVSFQTFSYWPMIRWPDEDWCGEFVQRTNLSDAP